MAKQTINIGTSPNDATGDPLRTAFDKANDNFDELYDKDTSLDGDISDVDYRRDMEVAATGSPGQVITYSSAFSAIRPVIFDYEGLGIEVTAYDADGFTIDSAIAGNFGYETKNNR